ncbi:MAG: DUF4474 domain-containing protein [Eubacteriales bacterium]
MRTVSARILSIILVFAVCVSALSAVTGYFAQSFSDERSISAVAEKSALPAIASPALPVQKVQDVAKAITDDTHEKVVTVYSFINEFLDAYLKGMSKLTAKIVDLGGKFPEFVNEYVDNTGAKKMIEIGMYFDVVNKRIIGKGQEGAFGIGFDVDLKQKMMYASINSWTRKLGFCRLYDTLAPALGVKYKTERVKFEYAGLDWMIQIWKGSYFTLMGGAEIGIYNKPKTRIAEFYDCIGDKDMLDMSMKLSKGNKVLFVREPQKHWWMNGFALSFGSNMPDLLTLNGSILFKDEGMLKAFLTAFDKVCANEGITYTLQGKCVSFDW